MAKKIINHIPSLSSLLLSGLVLTTATGCSSKKNEKCTTTATEETQKEAPAQPSETKVTDTAEGEKASAKFKQMSEEQRRSLLEAMTVVLADSNTLETLKGSPFVHPEHEIDKADSPDIKKMGEVLCKTFRGRPYAEATTLHGWSTFDWKSAKKKVARLKALNKVAEAYQVPCDIAQSIAVDLLQGADFGVLDELGKLQEYEKNVLGMHDGQNVLKLDNTFSPPLEDFKQFDTTPKFLKLLQGTLPTILDKQLGQVVVNAGTTTDAAGTKNLTAASPGERGGPWDRSWSINSVNERKLPNMAAFLITQAPYTISPVNFKQLFFAVFGGDTFDSGDCFKVDVNATTTPNIVKEVKLHKKNLMTILKEAGKSEDDFASFLGKRLQRKDLNALFPVADVDESYKEAKNQIKDFLEQTDEDLAGADVDLLLGSLAAALNGGVTKSVAIRGNNTGNNPITDSTSYQTEVGLLNNPLSTIDSAQKKLAFDVLTDIEALVLTKIQNQNMGRKKAFASAVNLAIKNAEGNFILMQEGTVYKPTKLTKSFQNQIKAMESAISAKNNASAVTYQGISQEVTPAFNVSRVHAVLKEAVADLRLYLQLPSSLQSVLAMSGAKGTVNYAQVLNMPGLSKQQVSRLDDIRMKFQQKVSAMQPTAAPAPAPAPAG